MVGTPTVGWKPTRKWIATQITATAALLTMFVTTARGMWRSRWG